METKLHIDRVDILRGAAIALVVLYHTMLWMFPGYRAHTYDDNGFLEIANINQFILNFNPAGQGWMGVSLFLVISGFLIHLIHLRSGTTLNAISFYSKRFWRIYPPYLIALLFFFIANIDTDRSGLLSHLFFVHNLNSDSMFSINPSFWSIAMEVQLYLIYPLLLYIARKTSMRNALFFTAAVHIILKLVDVDRQFNPVYEHNVFIYWFVWCAGAFLAQRFYSNQPIFKKAWIWFILFGLLFFLSKYNLYAYKFHLLFLTLSFMALFEMVLYFRGTTNAIWSGLGKALTFLGICSYSLYLIHQPYLNTLLEFFKFRSHNLIFKGLTVCYVYAVLILISYASYKLIEVNSVAVGNYFRKRWKSGMLGRNLKK